jgi:trimeric autotransporter adhesin
MNTTHTLATGGMFRRGLAVVLFALFSMMLMLGTAHAAPAAGTVIGNQAAATYTDASGTARTSTSNTVTTTVAQVASFTLTATQSKIAAAGSTVYFPHTLTNTGNGTDTFNLAVTSPTGTGMEVTGFQLFPDANGDGIPDTGSVAITSTGALAAGAIFQFVAVATVPATAVNGNADTLTVTAVDTFATPAPTQTNTDTVTVTGAAVVSLTKSQSLSTGAPSAATCTTLVTTGCSYITYTLTYTNNGNATATAVTLGDLIPAGTTYVPGSGLWSGSATALTDAAGGDPVGINYDFGVTTANKATAIVASVAPGASGNVSVKVFVNSTTAPGTVANTASLSYLDGATTPVLQSGTSNTTSFAVLQNASVVANGLPGAATNAVGDTVTVPSAAQGSTVTFNDYVWNTGNGTDTFDLTLTGSTFPAGTTFLLTNATGTPLVNTGGTGAVDTGPLAAGSTGFLVLVKATLPAGATGGPFSVTLNATSVFDPTKTDPIIDTLTLITSSTVDLTNNKSLAGGALPADGAGPNTPATIVTNAIAPGASTTFPLFVNNTSLVADNYNLSVAGTPPGATVTFKLDGGAGNCSTTGATVTNTSSVAPAGNVLVCAVVSMPANALANATGIPLTFKTQSAVSGATDTIIDAVTVNTVRSVTLTTNNSGQAAPGGSVVYTQTLTNGGNVTEAITFGNPFLTDSQIAAGWTSVLYQDNGSTPLALDATDTAVTTATTFTLAPGASSTLFVKVFAPSTASAGQIDSTVATASYTNTTGVIGPIKTTSATDTTTVVSGVVSLLKEQALDANCDGTPETAFAQTPITSATAIPGACIQYRITATNTGNAAVTAVVINDTTPSFTTYSVIGGAANCVKSDATACTVAAPAAGAAGTVTTTVGALAPLGTAVVKFNVKILP